MKALMLLFALTVVTAQQACTGTFQISQPELENCTVIIGHIFEDQTTAELDIVLPLLVNITGRIKVTDTKLRSISLPSLQTAGAIELYGNSQLESFSTPCLVDVSNKYWVEFNAFKELALPSLKSVGQFLEILQFPNVISTVDLRNLASVGDYCTVSPVGKELCVGVPKCVAPPNRASSSCTIPPRACGTYSGPPVGRVNEYEASSIVMACVVTVALLALLACGCFFALRVWRKTRVSVGGQHEEPTRETL